MGASKRKNEAFLAKHPICCFCGGGARSTTQDHIPSRAMFRGRVWPEGYNFPACDRCQGATSVDEMLVALISRMGGDEDPKELAYFQVLLKSAENNFPGILASFRASANQKRGLARRPHVEIPHGVAIGELPIVALTDPRVEAAIVNFGRKLFLSLYYRHTGRVISERGGARFRWWTNANDLTVLKDAQSMLRGLPTLKRAKTDLSDQFYYQFVSPDDNPALYAFLASFNNNTFCMLGMAGERLEDVAFDAKTFTVRPYIA